MTNLCSECVESEIEMHHSEKEHHNKETDVVTLFSDNKTNALSKTTHLYVFI